MERKSKSKRKSNCKCRRKGEIESNPGIGLRDFAELILNPDLSRLENPEPILDEIHKAAVKLEFAVTHVRRFGVSGLRALMNGENEIGIVLHDILPSFLGRYFYMERGYYGNNERLSTSGEYVRFDGEWERFDMAVDGFSEALIATFPEFAGRIASARMHTVDYANGCDSNNWHGENLEPTYKALGRSAANEAYTRLRDEITPLLHELAARQSEPAQGDRSRAPEASVGEVTNQGKTSETQKSGQSIPRKRGRTRKANASGYAPSEEKLLAAVRIVETLRAGTAGTQRKAIVYCTTHGEEDSKARCMTFDDDGSTLKRWAAHNGTTVTALRELSAEAWTERKKTLK